VIPKIGYKMTIALKYAFEMEGPDEEDYRSFLLGLRPFLLKKDPLHFESISADLQGRLTDDELKDACARNRKDWKQVLKGQDVLHVGAKEYVAVDLFELIAYGELFHVDAARQAEFALLPKPAQDMARFNMFSFGFDAVRVLITQENVIARALETNALDLASR